MIQLQVRLTVVILFAIKSYFTHSIHSCDKHNNYNDDDDDDDYDDNNNIG